MADWMNEIRYGARVLAKSPTFTIVAILSLALGIGVNTAVLAVGRAVLLAPLPVPDPGQLAIAYWWRGDRTKGTIQFNSGSATDERTGRSLNTNYAHRTYTALRASVADRADLFAFTFARQVNISLGGQPVVGGGMLVSGNYFASMRVPMHLGRGIDERDDQSDAESVAVLGYGVWQRAFGGDPSIVGKPIRINGRPFTLIGVTARGYFGVSNGGFFPPADVTLPLSAQPLVFARWATYLPAGASVFTSDRPLWLRVMLRLKPGNSHDEVEQILTNAFVRRLNESEFPVAAGSEPPMIRLMDGSRGLDSLRSSLQKPLLLLGGVAALVFLIACVNIASLVLVRGVARQQEFWIRLALGAGRGRLVRQTIVESVLLAAAGGASGVLLALWSGRLIVFTLAGSTANALTVNLDLPLVLVALGVSGLAAVLFGVAPALRLATRERTDMMRQTGAGIPRLRAGGVLVLVQVAIAIPLVVGAALFLRTLHNLAGVELGFEPRGLVMFRMDPTLNGYDEERAKALYERVLARVSSIPGVRATTLVENALVSGWVSNTRFSADGTEPKSMLMNRVGPGFFETVGLPIIAGRGLGLQDDGSAPSVGVINEAGAKAFFGDANPVGRHVQMSGTAQPPMIEIVGVARDSRYDSLKKEPQPTIYLPYFQSKGLGAMFVAVRTSPSATTERELRLAVAEVDSEVPITDYKTQLQQIDETIGSERALTLLLVSFGVFALLLACIGLHGVTAYAVARRTNEIGIRLALGAQRHNVLWLVLRQVVLLAAGGLLIGIPAAALGSRAVQAYLFGVEPADPASIALGAAILFGVAVAAGLIPARRAARMDPLVALRRE